jgi:hypothetical protein
MENIIYFFTKQAIWTRRATLLSLPLQLVFPDLCIRRPWRRPAIIDSIIQSRFE